MAVLTIKAVKAKGNFAENHVYNILRLFDD